MNLQSTSDPIASSPMIVMHVPKKAITDTVIENCLPTLKLITIITNVAIKIKKLAVSIGFLLIDS